MKVLSSALCSGCLGVPVILPRGNEKLREINKQISIKNWLLVRCTGVVYEKKDNVRECSLLLVAIFLLKVKEKVKVKGKNLRLLFTFTFAAIAYYLSFLLWPVIAIIDY